MSDSELDVFERSPKPKPKRKSASKEISRSHSAKKPKDAKKLDVLGLVSEDDENAVINQSARGLARGKHLDSCISTRVANGCVLRRAPLRGEYYVETRVYTADDALSASPDARYKKALVTLKVQLDADQPEWNCLQKFLQKAKTSFFADTKPIFYNNYI